MAAIVAVAVVVLIVVVGVAAVLTSRAGDSSEEANGDTSSTATTDAGPPPTAGETPTTTARGAGPNSTAPSPTTAAPVTTTAPPPDDGDVPHGLFCRDLVARGFSYDAAVAYWFQEGQPDRMDEDLNGIPCETLYPASDVEEYFGPADAPPPDDEGVPHGLFCRDLVARGFSYDAAVAYWFQEGQPDRMDEDLNGIPCETVYPRSDIDAVFG